MAKTTIADLIFNVRASTADFERGMKKVRKQFDGVAKQLDGFGKAATKAFAPITAALAGLSIAGARFANTLDDVSSKLKINAEALQILRVAADEGSVSNERLEKGLRNITDRTLLAAQGNKSYREAIEALGYTTEDFIKLPLERKFSEIGKAYVNATDKAKAHEAVMKLVGTMSGPELIKTLEAVGIEGFDALAIRARAAGLVLSAEATTRISDFIGKLDQLKLRLQVLGAEIANRLIKQFQALNNALGITDKIKALYQWFDGLSDTTKQVALNLALVAAAIGPVALVLSKVVSITGSMVINFAKVWHFVAPLLPAIKAIGAALAGWPAVIAAIVVGIFSFVDGVNGIGDALIGAKMRTRLQLFAAELAKTAIEWGAKMLVVIADIDRYFLAAWATSIAWVVHQFQNGLLEKIGKAISWAWGAFTGLFSRVSDFIYDAFTGAFEHFLNGAKAGLNILIKGANKLLGVNVDLFDVDGFSSLSDTLGKALERSTAPFKTALEGGVKDAMNNFDASATFKQALGEGDTVIGGLIKGLAGGMTDALGARAERLRSELAGMEKATGNIADKAEKAKDEFNGQLAIIRKSREELLANLGVLRLRAAGQDSLAQAVEDELTIQSQIADIVAKTNWSEREAEAYLREKLNLERQIASVKESDRVLTREERKAARDAERQKERAAKRAARDAADPRINLGDGKGSKRWSSMSGIERSAAQERYNQGYGADGKIRPDVQARAMLGQPMAQPAAVPLTPPPSMSAGSAAVHQSIQQAQAAGKSPAGDSALVGAIQKLIEAFTAGNTTLNQTIATAFPA